MKNEVLDFGDEPVKDLVSCLLWVDSYNEMQYIIFSFAIHYCHDLFMDNLRCSESRRGFPSIACKTKMRDFDGEEARVRQRRCVMILVLHVHSSCLITLLGPLSIPYSCSFRLYVHLWSLTTAQKFCSEIMIQMNRKRLSDGWNGPQRTTIAH